MFVGLVSRRLLMLLNLKQVLIATSYNTLLPVDASVISSLLVVRDSTSLRRIAFPIHGR